MTVAFERKSRAKRIYMVLKTWRTTYNYDSVLHDCVSQSVFCLSALAS